MNTIDETINDLGYVEVERDYECNCITYHNKDQDTEITIQWDEKDEECLIFANTISTSMDYYSHLFNHPLGLSITECTVFTKKIQEMRGIYEA